MASREFLEKRVAGKEAEITKLEKKLERILKAQASNWTNNPYYYSEDDLKWTNKDLETAKAALEKYRAQLKEATDKENSRNVEVIIKFLENWKAKTMKFYITMLDSYLTANEEFHREYKELDSQVWNRELSREERNAARAAKHRLADEFRTTWSWISEYVERKQLNLERLDKDLSREADRKYDFIIERTTAITGEITDASNLHFGEDGCELNGYIIGKEGRAKVQTIGAGGWNIQRFHFRTLVRAI